jgi:tetratricopeptide (TPR) repeat protein
MRIVVFLWAVAAIGAEPSPAEKLIEAGHWKRARSIVEARLREAPDDALSNFLLSQIRGAFGDRATPLPLAEKAVALDGNTAKHHRQVAEVLGIAAQHAGAFQLLLLGRRFRKELDTALARDPQDIQALRDLLEFYLVAPGITGGDPRKAVDVAGQIGGLDQVEGLLARARIAEFHKQTARKQELLGQAAEAQPPRYKALIALAQHFLKTDPPNVGAAEAQAKIAMNLDPGRVDAYSVLAAVHADRGEWSQLDSTLTIALREVPDDAAPHYRAAERLLASGRDPGRAERYLQVYLAQAPEGNQPSIAEARWKLGLALEAQGRVAAARAEFQESVRLDPESKAAEELKRLRNTRAESSPSRNR